MQASKPFSRVVVLVALFSFACSSSAADHTGLGRTSSTDGGAATTDDSGRPESSGPHADVSEGGIEATTADTTSGGTKDSDSTGNPESRPYDDDPAIIQLIDNLDDNTALELDPYEVAGDRADEWMELYGTAPQRRDFCNELAYAPDRGTALYTGANHGVPHRLNDAWEYHLGSNTWVLLFFPDDDMRNSGNSGWYAEYGMIEDGYLQSKRHGMLIAFHTWDGLAYDHQTKRMLFANIASARPILEHYAEQTGQDYGALQAMIEPGSNLWMYDPEAGRWFKQMGPDPHPLMRLQAGAFEYLPDLKKSIWYASQWNEAGMWSYDSATNVWENLQPNGGASTYADPEGRFPPAEAQMRYSTTDRTLVAVLRTKTWHYSVDDNEWALAADDPVNEAGDWLTVFVHDDHSNVFLLLQPQDGLLRAYHVDTKTWETLTPQGAAVPSHPAVAGYFDSEHNVMVVYEGNKSQTWLYRYRR